MAVTAPWMYPQTLLFCAWKWPKTAPSATLTGRAHPAILTNSRWRAVSCIAHTVNSVFFRELRWGNMHSSINIIAAVGLALGGVLGLVGAIVTQQNLQAILWAIDGAGLVMATPLLAIKYFRRGNDIVAGGFLVFAIGEGIILLSGPAAGLAGSIPAFAAGTAFGERRFSWSVFQSCSPCRSESSASRARYCLLSPRLESFGVSSYCDVGAAADLRLSPPGSNLLRLDLDALARGRQQIATLILKFQKRTPRTPKGAEGANSREYIPSTED